VEEVTEGNEKQSLLGYFQALTADQREAIDAVAIDMSPAYIAAVRDGLPEGRDKIVFNRFLC
jgi:transposase